MAARPGGAILRLKGDTGNSEWVYRRDTQRFMVAWMSDRPGGCQQQWEPYTAVEFQQKAGLEARLVARGRHRGRPERSGGHGSAALL